MADTMEIIVTFKNKAKAGVQGLQNNLKNLGNQADSTANKIASVTTALTSLTAVVSAGAFMTSAVSAFADFDDNMRAAGAVTNATTEELEEMTEVAKKMGEETRYSAAQSAEALKFLGMAGFTAAEATEALPGVLNLAAAGAMDLGTAADIATNILTGYGKEVSELQNVNDVLAKTFTSSNVNMVEIGEAFKMVGPIAKGVGADFEDLVATIGLLGDAGIKGTMAGTALKNTLDALLAPTKQEAELFAEFAQRIGQTSLEIKDADGNFLGFAKILEQLEKAGIRGDEALQAFGMRAGPGLAALLNQGSDALKELTTELKNSEGTAKTLAELMEKGLGGALRATKSVFEGLQIAFGDAIDEELIEFLAHLRDVMREIISTTNTLAKEGTFKRWGESAIVILDSLTWSLEKAYHLTKFFTDAWSSFIFAIQGNNRAAIIAYEEMGESALKLYGIHQDNAPEVITVTKEITKEMLATRESTRKAREEAEALNKVIVGYREDGTAITMAAERMETVTNEIRASKEQLDAFEKNAKKAYKQATTYAQQYAEQVVEWEERIKQSRRDTEDTIREIGRKGLSDYEQWVDRKAEAEEKLSAAREAFYTKDYALAEQLAKESEALFASLAEEVTKKEDSGESAVVKSLEQTKKIAIDGIREVGEFNNDLFTEQKKGAAESQKTWEQAADLINKKLDEITKAREANIAINLSNLDQTRAALNSLLQPETKTIYVKTVQTSQTGGPVLGFNDGGYVPRSGKIPGYGGGDKVRAILEPGEGILTKEAMSVIGVNQLNDWNALRFNLGGAVPDEAGNIPVQNMGNIGGGPSETLVLRFQAGEAEANVQVSDVDSQISLKLFAEELEKMRLSHVE